ncbi:MAG: hypothetical protein QOF35_1040, partial [Actinomycetota bacterium]|nr:hypothetical protein [Actinomycetota bacterium]
MNDYESTRPPEILPNSSNPPARVRRGRWARVWRVLSNRLTGWIVAGALTCAVIGLAVALVMSSATSSTALRFVPGGGAAGRPAGAGAGGASNARSGPAAGGAAGTVGNVSSSGFTLSTSASQQVTVEETSSTTYQNATSSASTSASAVTTGKAVLVLGTTSGTTITATQVIVHPAIGGSTSSSAAQVVPFQQGAPTTSKEVGQIPAGYSEGSGTIVSGTVANKATEAALAAYPGGVVDRVVRLSNGEFEVHNIGVNWP